MKPARLALFPLVALLAAGSAALAGPAPRAPQPAKPVEMSRFYVGRWHEIARLPEKLTDGCVAGWTDYTIKSPTEVHDRDGCNMDTPAGKEKTIAGPGTILDPGTNAKLRVRYRFMGFIPITRDYWVLDHADDYSWFISADPAFERAWIYTRDPQVGAAEKAALVGRLRALGYDVGKLEFPAQPARGAQPAGSASQ